ncbi:MAG: DNA translocase FtsK [Acidobacteriota bacterium]
MAVATTEAGKKGRARPRLAPEKRNELSGLLLLTVALLLVLSLVTFDPRDPSLLHRPADPEASAGNWIGPVGAELAAVSFGLFGIAAFGLPIALALAGWRRMRGRFAKRTFGRGFGAVVVLLATPAFLQLTVGRLPWRGGDIAAGGAFGELLSTGLAGRLNVAGALLVLVAALLIGCTLLVQSTLGELLEKLMLKVRAGWQEMGLARARRRERKAKDRAREKVVKKHLARAAERRAGTAGDGAKAAPEVDLPLRVREKAGAGEFSVRRVAVPSALEEEPPATGKAPARRRKTASGRKASPDRQLELVKTPPATKSGLPPINLLQMAEVKSSYDENALVQRGEAIRARCAEFGVEGTIEGISPGPVITIFEFQPAPGVKVSQIVNLQDDLALALKADSVRIDRIPGRSTLGIEVPNDNRSIIRLGPMLGDKSFVKAKSKLTLAMGRDIHGEPYFADLATMPHLLVAGATGAGKSVGLQAMITSILYKAHKDEVKFIFIDPKRIELGVYADIPHLAAEVVVDMKKAAVALQRMVKEMEDRYKLLAEVHVRSIGYYNQAIRDPEVKKRLALNDEESDVRLEDLKPLPYYVIIIDELADLMMVASSEVETAIARLAQMARAVGIHLIVATQRPSVDVLTGTIKANFPCRVSYATATRHDSRTILDRVGSEQLLGKGDMLFMPPGTSRIVRLHGAYVSEQETAGLVRWLKKTQGKPEYNPELLEPLEASSGGGDAGDADDELYDEAVRMVVSEGQASASFLQRRMRVGFSRASRLIDIMERDGILGPPQGSKPREVLVKADYFEEMDLAHQQTAE